MKILAIGFVSVCAIYLSGCSAENLTKDNPNQPAGSGNPISLERDFQEVIHYGCDGTVTSDGIETVSSPTKWVTITPNDSTNLEGSSFTDTLTNSEAGLMMGYTTFQVDYSYGALNMHVVSGVNVIDYTFTKCTQWVTNPDGSQSCPTANEVVSEQGTVTINVSYSEKTLPGHTDVDDCPTPSPTPSP